MKNIIIVMLLFTIVGCNSTKKTTEIDKEMLGYETLTVIKIQSQEEGYKATLKNNFDSLFTCNISTTILKDDYVKLRVGDKVKIAGDYAESIPVRIYAKRIVKVN